MMDFEYLGLVDRKVIVSNASGSISQRCIIELGVDSSRIVQKHKRCTHPPAFQARSLESGEVLVLFNQDVAKILSGGEPLSMKLSG